MLDCNNYGLHWAYSIQHWIISFSACVVDFENRISYFIRFDTSHHTFYPPPPPNTRRSCRCLPRHEY